MEIVVIVVIAVLVLVAGVLVARKGFVRGTIPETPSEDLADRTAQESPDVDEPVTSDPSAMGRPSDRGTLHPFSPEGNRPNAP